MMTSNISTRIKDIKLIALCSGLLLLSSLSAAQETKQELVGIDSAIVYRLYETGLNQNVTSSISTVNGDKISKNTVMSLGNALYGFMSGLFVKQTTGEPGEDYPELYIRGKHTYTGSNEPLVLVDGFPRDFNTLNVEEVESISVLKDAASTAMYGLQGANGIVLVTTKRGVAQKVKIGFKAEYGYMMPTRLPKLYGSYDYASYYNMAEKNDGKVNLTYSDVMLDGYKNRLDNILYPDVNWLDEALRKCTPTQNYIMDFRGGNSVAKFYVNVGYTKSEGLYKELGNKEYDANRILDRMNFRSNIDVDITKELSMTVDISGRLENLNQPSNTVSSIWNNLCTFHPNAAPIYVDKGVWGGSNTYKNNPIAFINDVGYRHTTRRQFQTNLRFNYDLSRFVKNLSIGVAGAFDNFYSVDNGYSKTFAVREALGYDSSAGNYVLGDPIGINSPLSAFGPSNNNEMRSNALETYLNHHAEFGNNKISSKLVYHQDSYNSYLSASDVSATPYRRINIAGKVGYSYKDKYIVDIAASYGASHKFMRGKRFGFFPAISAGWIVSKENFMSEVPTIDFLKLRVSTGIVGNQNIGGTVFAYRDLYRTSGGGWIAGPSNTGTGGGYAEASFANPNLTWEKSLKTDVGLDMTILKRINMSLTYFYEYRYDILNNGSSIMPSYLGASFGYINYGEVASKGFELSLEYAIQKKDWGVNMILNVSQHKNKILKMRETVKTESYLYRIGKPIEQTFGLMWDGYYSVADVSNREITQSWGNVIPGSLKYVDVNGDGVVDSNDVQAIGKSLDVPEWDLGFSLGINYKGIYVNANFQAALGRTVNLRMSAPYTTSPLYYDRNVSTWIKQPWTTEVARNPELAKNIDFPSFTIENATNNFQNSTYYMRNGNFLRLRMLEVGYQMPEKWMKSIKVHSAKVFVRGMNVFTLDNLGGYFDPEVPEGYPVMKTYNVGVNITF